MSDENKVPENRDIENIFSTRGKHAAPSDSENETGAGSSMDNEDAIERAKHVKHAAPEQPEDNPSSSHGEPDPETGYPPSEDEVEPTIAEMAEQAAKTGVKGEPEKENDVPEDVDEEKAESGENGQSQPDEHEKTEADASAIVSPAAAASAHATEPVAASKDKPKKKKRRYYKPPKMTDEERIRKAKTFGRKRVVSTLCGIVTIIGMALFVKYMFDNDFQNAMYFGIAGMIAGGIGFLICGILGLTTSTFKSRTRHEVVSIIVALVFFAGAVSIFMNEWTSAWAISAASFLSITLQDLFFGVKEDEEWYAYMSMKHIKRREKEGKPVNLPEPADAEEKAKDKPVSESEPMDFGELIEEQVKELSDMYSFDYTVLWDSSFEDEDGEVIAGGPEELSIAIPGVIGEKIARYRASRELADLEADSDAANDNDGIKEDIPDENASSNEGVQETANVDAADPEEDDGGKSDPVPAVIEPLKPLELEEEPTDGDVEEGEHREYDDTKPAEENATEPAGNGEQRPSNEEAASEPDEGTEENVRSDLEKVFPVPAECETSGEVVEDGAEEISDPEPGTSEREGATIADDGPSAEKNGQADFDDDDGETDGDPAHADSPDAEDEPRKEQVSLTEQLLNADVVEMGVKPSAYFENDEEPSQESEEAELEDKDAEPVSEEVPAAPNAEPESASENEPAEDESEELDPPVAQPAQPELGAVTVTTFENEDGFDMPMESDSFMPQREVEPAHHKAFSVTVGKANGKDKKKNFSFGVKKKGKGKGKH